MGRATRHKQQRVSPGESHTVGMQEYVVYGICLNPFYGSMYEKEVSTGSNFCHRRT